MNKTLIYELERYILADGDPRELAQHLINFADAWDDEEADGKEVFLRYVARPLLASQESQR